MESLPSHTRHDYEKHIAHVIWAAHILHYLVGERNQTGLLPELDTDEDFDADAPDFETQDFVVQTDTFESIRSKLLDSVAELLSPSKGWDYVVSVGLRESVECIELDVARNDGFSQAVGSKAIRSLARDGNTWYINQLEQYLAADEDVSSIALSGFDLTAINFHRQRVDYWITVAREYITALPSLDDYKGYDSTVSGQAAEKWADLAELLSQRVGEVSREMIVHSAYSCVSTNEVLGFLQANFNAHRGSRLWRVLRLITKPVFNSHLLKRIARRIPNFQKVRINLLPQLPKTQLHKEYLVGITSAWSQLCSVSSSTSDIQRLYPHNEKFKLDCARTFGSHSEVQLLLYYENNNLHTPSIGYFGCSKKSCLLCEALLQNSIQPTFTRGRHGICYPQWGVPYTESKDILNSLQDLKNMIIGRIKMHLNGQVDDLFHRQVPQSTIASNVPTTSLEEISKKAGVIKSIEKNRQTLAEQRSILDGRSSKRDTNTAPAQNTQSSNYCVMCNVSPAQLCKRCKSCYYCSRVCQESDWPCHKILCKQVASLSPRPSPSHKLAIFFSETGVKPILIWIECYRETSSEYEGNGIVVEYEMANVRPLLGNDDPFPGRVVIEYNNKRGKRLGSGLYVLGSKKEGYGIKLTFRDAALIDGSELNRSVIDSEVREITNPQAALTTHRAVRGVKICCYGEIKLHGADPFVPIEVPSVHPIYNNFYTGISPISKILGKPLRLWKFEDIETWLDPPGWNESLCAESNQDAAFLMIEADAGKDGWGLAPMDWSTDIGNVLVICDDKTHLLVEELRLVCYFVREILLPMFEDAMGLGLVSRTKEEVLKFITHENMAKFEKEAEDDQGAFA